MRAPRQQRKLARVLAPVRTRVARALLTAALLTTAGCNASADVVAAPLGTDGGDAPATDGGKDAATDGCDLATRFERARLPDLALDLILDCEVHFATAPSASQDAGRGITPEEFSKLVTAPQLEGKDGLIGEALCEQSATTGGWYALPFDKPERAVLCPKSCELFREQISRLLARDGCDGPFDAGMGFGGLPGGPGFPGGGDRDDDAGSFR